MYFPLLSLCAVVVIAQQGPYPQHDVNRLLQYFNEKDLFFNMKAQQVPASETCGCEQKSIEKNQLIKNTINQLQQISADLTSSLTPLGTESSNAASSCKAVRDANPDSASGYYWIHGGSGPCPVRMFCDMEKTCNGISGGWMKIADIDMRNRSQSCPSGLRPLTNFKRRCSKNGDSRGCGSATFSLHGISYGKVCGKIIGYQDKSTGAFRPYHDDNSLTVDGTYVDGVSLTHGQNPRKHIWTFASAYDEGQSRLMYVSCPCTHNRPSDIPPFVGNNYFCDSGNGGENAWMFHTDPLWDGAGCGKNSNCCSFNNPPWFTRTLPSTTNQDIEMRLCRNQDIGDEDVGVEQVELYVQ